MDYFIKFIASHTFLLQICQSLNFITYFLRIPCESIMNTRVGNGQSASPIKNLANPVKENRMFTNGFTSPEAAQRNGIYTNGRLSGRQSNQKDFFTFKTASTNQVSNTNNSYQKNGVNNDEMTQRYRGNETTNVVQSSQKYSNGNFDASSRPRESLKKNTPHTLSWTNFIAMQFKTEQLQNQVNSQLLQLKQKSDKIEQLQRTIKTNKSQYESDMRSVEYRYMKQLEQQKNKYEQDINNKKEQINSLIHKLSDQTKQCLAEEIKSYISSILQKCSQLQSALLSQKQKNQSLTFSIAELEEKAKVNEDQRNKADQCLKTMEKQLSMLTNKILYRSGYSTQSNSLLQVIQAQANQVTELRANFQQIQSQFLKIRAQNTELKNKIGISQQSQNANILKLKCESNALIVDLGFNLTNKQNQVSSLNRKLSQTERKYKQIVSDHKSRADSIQKLFLMVKENCPIDPEQFKQQLKACQINNHCDSCIKLERELQSTKQKFTLLTN